MTKEIEKTVSSSRNRKAAIRMHTTPASILSIMLPMSLLLKRSTGWSSPGYEME